MFVHRTKAKLEFSDKYVVGVALNTCLLSAVPINDVELFRVRHTAALLPDDYFHSDICTMLLEIAQKAIFERIDMNSEGSG